MKEKEKSTCSLEQDVADSKSLSKKEALSDSQDLSSSNDKSASTLSPYDYAQMFLRFLPSSSIIPPQTKFHFTETCANLQLNPFNREIYLINRRKRNQKTGLYEDLYSIVVGYEVYRKRAERIGDMDGGVLIETSIDDTSKLPIKSCATLYRKGKTHPYSKTVYFEEFAQKTLDGKLSGLWASKPIFMLEKVAETTLLRMAYPCEFANLPYTSDELPGIQVATPDVSQEALGD